MYSKNLTILFLIVSITAFAQSKKDIRKNNVKTLTETITNYENGKETTLNDVFRRFDKNGEVIEEINYDKNGKMKSKTITKYKDEDKTEETIFDANGKQLSREVYKYNVDGEKVEELHYDAKNELESRSLYTLKRGLKLERKTYDEKGKLIQVKKYNYGL